MVAGAEVAGAAGSGVGAIGMGAGAAAAFAGGVGLLSSATLGAGNELGIPASFSCSSETFDSSTRTLLRNARTAATWSSTSRTSCRSRNWLRIRSSMARLRERSTSGDESLRAKPGPRCSARARAGFGTTVSSRAGALAPGAGDAGLARGARAGRAARGVCAEARGAGAGAASGAARGAAGCVSIGTRGARSGAGAVGASCAARARENVRKSGSATGVSTGIGSLSPRGAREGFDSRSASMYDFLATRLRGKIALAIDSRVSPMRAMSVATAEGRLAARPTGSPRGARAEAPSSRAASPALWSRSSVYSRRYSASPRHAAMMPTASAGSLMELAVRMRR